MRNIIIFIIILGFCFVVLPALADVGAPQGGDVGPIGPDTVIPNILKSDTFEDLVKAIANFLYLVLAPIAVIMVLYSAFLFMTSGGSEERVKKAKKALLWTVVGVAIILVGAGFVTLIKAFLET